MEFLEQFIPNATIVVLCVILGLVMKSAFARNEQMLANIPWLLAVTGAVLGVVGTTCLADFEGLDVLTALAQGAVSGLAAGGAYQVVHQQIKAKEDTVQGTDAAFAKLAESLNAMVNDMCSTEDTTED